ncbi:MAG: hypothetical protein BZY88_05760 [SAR202 cluster bacterium Io17-Chloro-G9]|nr:MAG: hypothetical protein BZY88_05760 [SAR202 cluster bacterium Io17-Chloro-G9]
MDYQPAHFAALPPPEGYDQHPLHSPENLRVEQISDTAYWISALSNAGWVITEEGVVLIDSGSNRREVIQALRRTTDKPIRYVIYTHGHGDHTFTLDRYEEFAEVSTRVVAHSLVPERLSKYEMLAPHIARTNQVQFRGSRPGRPLPTAGTQPASPPGRKYPDTVYDGEFQFTLGGRRFDLFHARAETDDATIVSIPDEGIVFAGDCLIRSWPNVGNPYKVPRYARGWYEVLERIQRLAPRVVAPGHGQQLLTDAGDIRRCLNDQIAGLRYVHDEVVRRMNEGQPLWKMVLETHLPAELEDSPWLEQSYSRVEFAVTAIWRGYGGWYDGDPSDLFAVPRTDVASTLRGLIGNDDSILRAARDLWSAGKRSQGLEVLQVLLRANPEHVEGRGLRLEFMETLLTEDKTLMSRGAWHVFADGDREFLAGVGEQPENDT